MISMGESLGSMPSTRKRLGARQKERGRGRKGGDDEMVGLDQSLGRKWFGMSRGLLRDVRSAHPTFER